MKSSDYGFVYVPFSTAAKYSPTVPTTAVSMKMHVPNICRQVLINFLNRLFVSNYSCCFTVIGNSYCELHSRVLISVTEACFFPQRNTSLIHFFKVFVLYCARYPSVHPG